MTPERFRECLYALDWTVHSIAIRLGVPRIRVRRWLSGESEVPDNVAAWLEQPAEYFEVNPMPLGWNPVVKQGRKPKEKK